MNDESLARFHSEIVFSCIVGRVWLSVCAFVFQLYVRGLVQVTKLFISVGNVVTIVPFASAKTHSLIESNH